MAFEEVSPRTFGFLGSFGIPAVLGPFFFWNEIFVFGFWGFSAVSSFFFLRPMHLTRVFFWNEVIFSWPSKRGGAVSPRTFGFFGFFGIPAVLGPFFWNEIFVFGFFGFSAVSSVFFKALPEPGFFGMRSFLFFLAFEEGGGGFSQDFWIFRFFESCSSGPLKFLFFYFLDFLLSVPKTLRFRNRENAAICNRRRKKTLRFFLTEDLGT